MRFSATRRTWTPGCTPWNPASLGTSQSEAKVTVVLTVSVVAAREARTEAVAARRPSSAPRTAL